MKPISMKDKFVYIVVMCEKPRFITSVDSEKRTCEWNATGMPYKFHSWEDANYVCMGLMWRGTWAFPVVTPIDMKEPFYTETEEEEKDA